jgi:hypothetical protein
MAWSGNICVLMARDEGVGQECMCQGEEHKVQEMCLIVMDDLICDTDVLDGF